MFLLKNDMKHCESSQVVHISAIIEKFKTIIDFISLPDED